MSEVMKTNELVKALCKELDTRYRGIISDRKQLYAFFEINDWFGLACVPDIYDFLHNGRDVDIAEEKLSLITERLILWLKVYQRENRTKYELFWYIEVVTPVTV